MTRGQWLSRLAAISRTTKHIRVVVEAGPRRVIILAPKRGRPKVVLPDTSGWDAAPFLTVARAYRRGAEREPRRDRPYTAECHREVIKLCQMRETNPARARILG